MLWQIVDIAHQQSNPGATTPARDVQLARLVPLTALEDNMHNYTIGQLLDMSLNYVHEAAHAVYLKHVYNNIALVTRETPKNPVWGLQTPKSWILPF